MTTSPQPLPSLFLDVLVTLERIGAPYMVVGAFATLLYGVNRNTHDIDVVVDLSEQQVQALANAYPPPRYDFDVRVSRQAMVG